MMTMIINDYTIQSIYCSSAETRLRSSGTAKKNKIREIISKINIYHRRQTHKREQWSDWTLPEYWRIHSLFTP